MTDNIKGEAKVSATTDSNSVETLASTVENDLDAEEMILFQMIPIDGEAIGNKALRKQLSWLEEKYWTVRDRLVDKNYIQTGMGRGGSVSRVKRIEPPLSVPIPATGIQLPEYNVESDLYAPVMDSLEKWSKEVSLSNFFIEKTANQGSRKTGGMWTRPDIVIINVESFQFVPSRYLEVMTFEIKPSDAWDISAVFETAAHSRFSSRSYLVLHRDVKLPPSQETIDRISSECSRFGVGLIIFDDPKDYETYEFLIEPVRRQPDPRETDKFIEIQISDLNKGKLAKWLR